MNTGAVWGILIVIILIVAGLVAWRTVGQNEQPLISPTLEPFVASPTMAPGQFFEATPAPISAPADSPTASSITY